MAESRRAKARRWLNRDFTKAELQGMVAALVADKVIDVATGGKLNALAKKAAIRIVWPLMKGSTRVAGTTAGRLAMTGLGVAKQIALKHPVLTGGAIVYYTYKNREEIGELVEQGYEILSPVGQAIQERLPPVPLPVPMLPGMPGMDITQALKGLRTKPSRPSKFNLAVKKGMATVKKSKSFGKPGIINNPKKAFATVTKTVALVKKTGKIAKSGIRRKIGLAVRRLWKRFR